MRTGWSRRCGSYRRCCMRRRRFDGSATPSFGTRLNALHVTRPKISRWLTVVGFAHAVWTGGHADSLTHREYHILGVDLSSRLLDAIRREQASTACLGFTPKSCCWTTWPLLARQTSDSSINRLVEAAITDEPSEVAAINSLLYHWRSRRFRLDGQNWRLCYEIEVVRRGPRNGDRPPGFSIQACWA